jgi:high affinity Mn2+ porin
MELSDALEPVTANGPYMDPNFTKTFGVTWESGFTYKVKDKLGGLSLLLYMNQNRGGNYMDAIAVYNQTHNPEALDVDTVSAYNGNKKYGFGLNWYQQAGKYIGLFARVGWNNGQNASWTFTDVDQTFTPGISINGELWHRKTDTFGAALIVNGISTAHRDFFNAGGYSFIIGDGQLPHYAPEEIFETYYNVKLFERLYCAVDYQYAQNPGYNADRGPVGIYSARVHVEF